VRYKTDRPHTEKTPDRASNASKKNSLPWGANAHNARPVTVAPKERLDFSSSSFLLPTPEVAERIRQQPECRLLWAILQDAIETYVKYTNGSTRRAKRLFVEAEAWMMQDDVTWLCSFVNICHILAIDPDYIRMGLKRWRLRVQPLDSQVAA
jgi:hypothetical protein